MRILKCLSWFEMNPHIKDCVSFESCVDDGNFSRKFDRRMMIGRMFNELFYSVSVYSSEREYVVYKTFPNERF